jgi:response regulator RpfG family c-di-GMP phosphodiesterase
MARILIVDDNRIIQQLLVRTIARYGHEYMVSANSEEARACLNTQLFELALCDVNMPGESGIDLARFIGSQYPDMAVIMVTGVDDPALAAAAIEAGTYGYIIKPFNPNELIINVQNALRRRQLEIEHQAYRQTLEERVRKRTAKLQKALEGIVHAMSLTVEKRDLYTAGHQHRVAILAAAIARELSLPVDQIEGIRMAGMIHDLGKIAVPAELLSKPSHLTQIEIAHFQIHPGVGHDIMADIEFPWPIAQMILEHHERIDGSGYPFGLCNKAILIEARILAVADVVEAMATHRPYRPSLGVEKALAEIAGHRAVLYDADVVDACLRLFQEKRFFLEPSFGLR